MFECFDIISGSQLSTAATVCLNYEQRQKSRGRARTDAGDELAWFLPRAQIMSDGDILKANDGTLFKVVAAEETLSEVTTEDYLLLTRVAYHLGNRHVPLQISANTLSYQHDHVLDEMVRGLGLPVHCVNKAFHPESGAYHSQGHSHAHEHHHASHTHEH